jgi:hypothetical protein
LSFSYGLGHQPLTHAMFLVLFCKATCTHGPDAVLGSCSDTGERIAPEGSFVTSCSLPTLDCSHHRKGELPVACFVSEASMVLSWPLLLLLYSSIGCRVDPIDGMRRSCLRPQDWKRQSVGFLARRGTDDASDRRRVTSFLRNNDEPLNPGNELAAAGCAMPR